MLRAKAFSFRSSSLVSTSTSAPALNWGLSLKSVAAALLLSAVLSVGIKSESLWTDEAFSAYLAAHQSFQSLWHTLSIGDSSDLQMWLYYSYLHFWVLIFGDRELTLRAANIPFILIYALAIVWTRENLFRSNWVWLGALSPFVWSYAGDARPYMAIVSLSTVFVLCLVASVTDPRYANSRTFSFVGLSALLLGLNLHLLMILALPPAIVFVLAYRFTSGAAGGVRQWLGAAGILSPCFLLFFAYTTWTIARGTKYIYGHPDLMSMGSVLFRYLGLSGFAPNRIYDIPFGPYIPGMALALSGVLVAIGLTLAPALRMVHARTVSVGAALLAGIGEATILSFVFKQQIEVRHMGCLFAFLLFLLFSSWEFVELSLKRRTLVASTVSLVTIIWFISDFRLTFLPEYRREDFRNAVAETLSLSARGDSEVAVVADPAAVAYYGLSVLGESPCFPLPGTCETALAAVKWPHLGIADQAIFWTPQRIARWLHEGDERRENRILLISRSRHPLYAKSAWWPALGKTSSYKVILFHGFFVYTNSLEKY